MNTWQTVYEQLQEIQDKIANKTLSEWCRYISKLNWKVYTYKWEWEDNYPYWAGLARDWDETILWHPISLSRVLSDLGKEYRVQRSEERIDYALKMWLVKKDAIWSTDWDTINVSWKFHNEDNSDCMLSDQSPETIKAIWEIVCK